MDTEKLTTRSRDAVSTALRTALTKGNPAAEPEHSVLDVGQEFGQTVMELLPIRDSSG